jgi:hypothetical protein
LKSDPCNGGVLGSRLVSYARTAWSSSLPAATEGESMPKLRENPRNWIMRCSVYEPGKRLDDPHSSVSGDLIIAPEVGKFLQYFMLFGVEKEELEKLNEITRMISERTSKKK